MAVLKVLVALHAYSPESLVIAPDTVRALMTYRAPFDSVMLILMSFSSMSVPLWVHEIKGAG